MRDPSKIAVAQLAFCMTMNQTSLSLIMTVAALSGAMLAGESPGLATLPIACLFVGILATIVASGLSFGLSRLLGRDLVTRHLHRSKVRAVNDRVTTPGRIRSVQHRPADQVDAGPDAGADQAGDTGLGHRDRDHLMGARPGGP